MMNRTRHEFTFVHSIYTKKLSSQQENTSFESVQQCSRCIMNNMKSEDDVKVLIHSEVSCIIKCKGPKATIVDHNQSRV